ncbi:chaperonin 10-like protein [Chytriomyces sp. MP71]|nr:chaperonin 10-like protein [Chytriomyces sp. MP71]
MKAVILDSPFHVSVREVPTPTVQSLQPGEALVKVSLAGLCGSDLHVYRGAEPVAPGKVILGHEMVGTVVAYNSGVSEASGSGSELTPNVRVGSAVLAPFTTSCGECEFCRDGFTARCIRSRLFGCETLAGAQAEFVVVPDAKGSLVTLDHLNHDPNAAPFHLHSALLCCDILPTGYFAVMQALLHPNLYGALRGTSLLDTLWSASASTEMSVSASSNDTSLTFAIVGLGPVGTCALISLLDILLHPTQPPLRLPDASSIVPRKLHILLIDGVASRREAAQRIVATIRKTHDRTFFTHARIDTLDIPEAESLATTGVVAAHAVLEVVGSNDALRLGYALLRPFGVLASVGVHTSALFPLTGDDLYNKNVALAFGRCPVRGVLPLALRTLARRQDVFARVASEDRDGVGLIDRIVSVDEAAEMYKLFEERKLGKVLFRM